MDIHNLRAMTGELWKCCLTKGPHEWLSDNVAEVIAWAGAWHLDQLDPDAAKGSLILVRLGDAGTGDSFGLLKQVPGEHGHHPRPLDYVPGCESWSLASYGTGIPELLGHLDDEEVVRLFKGYRPGDGFS